MTSITNTSALAALVAGFVLSGAVAFAPATSQAAYAGNPPVSITGSWKINVARSHFGPDRNSMVIDRAGTSDNSQDGSRTFVVISNGKVYLATSSEAFDKITGNGVKKVDYSRWKDMKLVQVGENAKAADICSFRCQTGTAEDHLTLTFKSVNGGMPEMGNIVVLSKR